MYSKELDAIIDASLADGVLTDKERAVLHKRAVQEGVDPDELDVVIEGRLAKMKQQNEQSMHKPAQFLANEKKGNVVKCPNCGCTDVAGRAVCPDCGYAFSNIGVSKSVERFKKELSDLNSSQERNTKSSFWDGLKTTDKKRDRQVANKMDFISKFPVPNSRADLLEFMQMIQPTAKAIGPKDGLTGYYGMAPSARQEDLSYAYWLLFANCVNKAKMSFQNDKDFAKFFEFYEKETAKSRGLLAIFTQHKHTLVLMSSVAALLLFSFICFAIIDKDDKERQQSLQEEVKEIRPQVDAQYEKLCSDIEELGIPNENNFEEIAFSLLNITWTKISIIGTENSPNPYEDAKKKDFIKKKEIYANRLQQIYKSVYGYSEDNDSLNVEYIDKTPKEIIDIAFDN